MKHLFSLFLLFKNKMANPPLSAIFTDIQSEEEIDNFYHQQDLQRLRELLSSIPLSKDKGIEESKIGMISLLWQHKIEIPTHLNLTRRTGPMLSCA